MPYLNVYYNLMFKDTVKVSEEEYEKFNSMSGQEQSAFIVEHLEAKTIILDGEEVYVGYPSIVEDMDDNVIFMD